MPSKAANHRSNKALTDLSPLSTGYPQDAAARFAEQARELRAAMDSLDAKTCPCGAPRRPRAANCRACHAKAQAALRARQAAELAALRRKARLADALLAIACPIDLRQPFGPSSG
jgi:hypothetical protein